MAYRVGVNIVMYALTGNYKADQVHVPALLERLGSIAGTAHELVDRHLADAARGPCSGVRWPWPSCWWWHCSCGARAARSCARVALAALLAALANPTLRQEERESLANIAIVVTDESTSQTIGGRPAADRRHPGRSRGQARHVLPGLEVKWVDCVQADGRKLLGHQPLRRSQSRARQRAAGPALRRHHDHRRPGARRAQVAPPPRLRCACPRAAHGPPGRVRPPHRGAEGAEVRHRRPGARDRDGRARDRPSRPRRRERVAPHPARGPSRRDAAHRDRPPRRHSQMPFPHSGQNILEIELEPVPGELTPANNRVVIAAEGVRENLRVLLVSGEPHAGERTWRNLLKSDAAVDLVHFTILRPPEKQDGTPDPSALAHRLPDARAVLGEDQGFRSDHLRPLPASRHPAPALLRQHRALRGASRRRAAGRRRRRFRRQYQPAAHAAGAGAARHAVGARARAAVQGAASPATA